MNVRIRAASVDELDKINAFYESLDYHSPAVAGDIACIAEDSASIVGAVRLSIENEIPVLRGMFVDKNYRGKGIGKLMLFFLEKLLPEQDCYCLPYAHLVGFYANIQFKQINENDLPPHLQQRLTGYLNKNLDMIGMKRVVSTK